MPVFRTPNPPPPPGAAEAPRPGAPPALAIDVISHSLDQTRRIGMRLAGLLEPGDVVLLAGPFGAGKTSLTQGIARGLGVDSAYVTSPTFTLINEYGGRLPLYHVDLYRLTSEAQAADLGLIEYLEGDGVTVVEWPERAPDLVPADHLTVHLSEIAETKRALRFEATGARYVDMLDRFKHQAFAAAGVPEGEPGSPPAGAPAR